MTKIRIEFTINNEDPYKDEVLMNILNDISCLSCFYSDYTCKVIEQ